MNQTNFVGVDTHKDTIACYVNGKFKEFPVSLKGFKEVISWSRCNKWAIEGAYCFGRSFAAYLIKNGHEVYEVNPLLTKSWRSVIAINGRKNDYGDAKVISLFAHTQPLSPVSLQTVKLKELISARNLAVKQRTQIINSIKMLYTQRGETLPFKSLTTIKAGKWLENREGVIIQNYANILITLNESIKNFEKEIEHNMPEKAFKLIELKGISFLTAAIIYTETKGRLISKGSLASYVGVAPVENSSGKKTKHRTNRGGNRQLNSVFYRLSIIQSRHDEEGKKYYEKKLNERKTPRQARKHLARQLVNQVWKILKD